ncbi:MAG TPA: hypothetical protein VLQ90_15895 [Pyrinomonadaceae bacterium]|nr:hypothetical protein [Pyrinomonadaceae bacterium]
MSPERTTVTIQTTGSNTGAVANISTRAAVGTGTDVLIAGVIVDASDKKILVRGTGPSLAGFGIATFLPDPYLELHDGMGTTVATNNDWQTTQIDERVGRAFRTMAQSMTLDEARIEAH